MFFTHKIIIYFRLYNLGNAFILDMPCSPGWIGAGDRSEIHANAMTWPGLAPHNCIDMGSNAHKSINANANTL